MTTLSAPIHAIELSPDDNGVCYFAIAGGDKKNIEELIDKALANGISVNDLPDIFNGNAFIIQSDEKLTAEEILSRYNGCINPGLPDDFNYRNIVVHKIPTKNSAIHTQKIQ